jgi:hypothetical protein
MPLSYPEVFYVLQHVLKFRVEFANVMEANSPEKQFPEIFSL